ncbi:hypothetical protein SBV45_02635 [Chlamydia crocodili]|uniref:hypothetical protein n=1 Tax=Chlamydia TaxID=810 RepID=UPI0035D41D87
MNGVTSPIHSDQIFTNKVSIHRFEKCLLSHTTAVAVGIVLILANVIGLAAYASSLPIFCSILLFASILIGIVLITVGAKYIHTYLSKTDFVDSSERVGYRISMKNLLLEVQRLQNTIREQDSYINEIENDIEIILQTRLEDKESYIEKIELLQFEMDEQNVEFDEHIKNLNAHISALEKVREDYENQQQEMVSAHFESSLAYEEEVQKLSKKLYEANEKIEQQRLQIQELREKLQQAKERARLMNYVQLRLSRDLQGARNLIEHLREELAEAPPKPRRPRSMSI